MARKSSLQTMPEDVQAQFHALVRATLPCADELRARMRAFAGVTTLLAAPKEDDA